MIEFVKYQIEINTDGFKESEKKNARHKTNDNDNNASVNDAQLNQYWLPGMHFSLMSNLS